MKVAYLSLGNIPSNWAHSLQMMKMGEGLAKVFPDFTFLCGKGENELSLVDLWNMYDIQRPFSFRFIPLPDGHHTGVFGLKNEKVNGNVLIEEAKSLGVDLVFTRDISLAWDCVLANIRVILEMHSIPIAEQAPSDVVKFAKHPMFTGLITLTPHLKECYVSMGVPREKVFVQVSAPCLSKVNKKQAHYKNRSVLYSGNIHVYKGAEFLIRLASYLKEYDFFCVGASAYENDLWRRRCIAADVSNIHYLDRLSLKDLSKLIGSMHSCILPNDPSHPMARASFPLKLMDYLSSGVPTVVSLTPCLMSSFIEHKKHVWMSSFTTESFAEGISEVCENLEVANTLSTNALTLSKEYTWEKRILNIQKYFVLK